jgi:integrase
MSPAWIRRRENTTRRTYQVLYRRGGRGYPIETAGTFRTEREAKLRRDLIAGWLAQGLNPKLELAQLLAEPAAPVTLAAVRAQYRASRIDAADNTTAVIRAALNRLAALDDRDPATVTVADLQARVEAMAYLKPATIHTYVTYWASLFDYAEVKPNPAASRQLRLPQITREQIAPPTGEQFVAAIERVPRALQLPLVVLEQTGMRIGELVTLQWGDVDERGCRFRLRSAETKTRRPRWVELPTWLMAIVGATLTVDDRAPARRVFPGFTSDSARRALARACTTAGIPVFTPHALRHRRATIWHHEGLPVRVLMERGGWSRSAIPLEVYSHLLPPGEVPAETLERLLVMPR